MGWFGICRGDPLVQALQETFGANIVRVPEQRIKPLCTVAVRGDRVAFRGALEPLLVGSQKLTVPGYARATSPMANLANRQSRSVDISLGLDILGQFLAGFGLPSAGIRARFTGAREVAFSFQGVQREWIDDNWLGRALAGRTINPQNTSARIYLMRPRWALLVIDSIIASRDFTISVTESDSDSFSIDIPAIQQIVGNVSGSISVDSAGTRDVTFRGPDPLTFAFTAVHVHLTDEGTIVSMPPGGDSFALALSGNGGAPTYGLDHIQLSEEPGLIEWDDIG